MTDYLKWTVPAGAALVVIGALATAKTLDSKPATPPPAIQTAQAYPAPEVSIVAQQLAASSYQPSADSDEIASGASPVKHARHWHRRHKAKPKDDELSVLKTKIGADNAASQSKGDSTEWKNWIPSDSAESH